MSTKSYKFLHPSRKTLNFILGFRTESSHIFCMFSPPVAYHFKDEKMEDKNKRAKFAVTYVSGSDVE
jgi:hypothetical protein